MKNQKSLTNKGFSLVELIIVVAIMAILIGVLAPQYLRYVEKSRLQKDNTSIGEIANVLKMAGAEETVINELNAATGGLQYTFDSTTGVLQVPGTGATNLNAELQKTITPADVKLTSSTYGKAATGYPVILVTVDSNSIVTVTASGWIDAPGATPTTTAAPKKF